ncbi:hypothetical protein SPRG_04603 [Saprolegnia parasitica CBS 223.65]|uniref:RING-type domain-containing protein n=1 Tax=Saprolegnia parasitica (strain CBS 223.65) TaxID=695850 RepID=A0A067CW27_SAPPC|nr:hypothetical protein SPRG_04603 [Saprolegnia parasitica CBS 223.65]KDO30701.1 hypothetical protein SPRG_04603 [Saprolegnia parasitica CBS 223.65]|eukprot:XP_012198405.1 hypothetical protein SPRG_04603 [Saprolegnia parasitica CBS 223.65]
MTMAPATIAALAESGAWPRVEAWLRNHTLGDVNATAGLHDATALSFAVQYGQADVLEQLLCHVDIDVDKANDMGRTPLHEAASRGRWPIADALLRSYANINAIDKHGRTPLHYATEADCDAMVRGLLYANANPHIKDKAGRLPIDVTIDVAMRTLLQAAMASDADCALRGDWRELERRAATHTLADVNIVFGIPRWTLLSYAARENQGALVHHLLRCDGVDINRANKDGMTALHEAAQRDHHDVLVALVEAGANALLKNKEGQLPIQLATTDGRFRMLLASDLSFGECAQRGLWSDVARRVDARSITDINTRIGEKRYTLLSLAARHDKLSVVRRLIEYDGVDLNAANIDGRTALHEAAAKNRIAILALLLHAGANTRSKTKSDETPRDVATVECRRLLEAMEGMVPRHRLTAAKDGLVCPQCTYANGIYDAHCAMCEFEFASSAKGPGDIAALEAEVERLHEATLCSICEELVKDTVFLCGHETCGACATKMKNCPTCRKPINVRIRRFV